MTGRAVLPEGLIERVLSRLDMPAYPERSPRGLEAFYRAWCRHVPFDNVRKLIAVRRLQPGPLPGNDPAEFLEAFLAHGVGGTCWAGNGALCAILNGLGFDARRAVATMVVAPSLPPNHGSVAVRFEGQTYLVDASIMHSKPLLVREGQPSRIDHPAWGVIGHWVDGAFTVRWRPLERGAGLDCRIDEWSVDGARFEAQHEATRTWSPFNFALMFNVIRGDGRFGMGGGMRIAIDSSGREVRSAIGDRIGFLVDELGISEALASRVPDDVTMPPPPGSRTAQQRGTTG